MRFIAVLSGGIPRYAFLREGIPADHILARLHDLMGLVQGSFITVDEAERRLGEVKVVFVSLPHNESQKLIPALARRALPAHASRT